MAQRPDRGTAPVKKPHEEEAAAKPQEKPQAPGTIAVVKSKIREKDLPPSQQEDSQPGTKISPSNISRVKKLKRGPSSENLLKEEVAAIKRSELRPEKVEDDLKQDAESELDKNQAALAENKSKKSIAKIIPSKKSLGPKEDEQTESVPAKKSEIRKESFITSDNQISNTGITTIEPQEVLKQETHKPEMHKPETHTVKNIQNDINQSVKKSVTKPQQSPKSQPERRNYLANVFPEPLDEYSAEEDEPKDQPDKKTDQGP